MPTHSEHIYTYLIISGWRRMVLAEIYFPKFCWRVRWNKPQPWYICFLRSRCDGGDIENIFNINDNFSIYLCIWMKNAHSIATDNSLERPSLAELISSSFWLSTSTWEGRVDVTIRSYLRLWVRSGIQTRLKSQWKTVVPTEAIAH